MMTRAQAATLAGAVAIAALGAGLLLGTGERLDPPEPIVVDGPQEPAPSTGPTTSGRVTTTPPTGPEIVPPPTVAGTTPPTPPAGGGGRGDDDADDGPDDGDD